MGPIMKGRTYVQTHILHIKREKIIFATKKTVLAELEAAQALTRLVKHAIRAGASKLQ